MVGVMAGSGLGVRAMARSIEHRASIATVGFERRFEPAENRSRENPSAGVLS